MNSLKNGLSVICISSVLFACGGGGGGGGGGGSSDGGVGLGGSFKDPATCVLPAGAVTISAINAESVVSEVKGAIQTILAFANAGSAFIEFNNLALPSNPAVVSCDMGGTASLTLTGTNPVSMGDQLETVFSNCVDTGNTINGTFTGTYNIINEAVIGEAGNVASANNWDFNTTGSSDNLRVNDSNIDVAANGDTTANVVYTAAGVDLFSTATNTLFVGADSADECVSIENASITSTAMNVSTNPSTYTVNVNPAAALIVTSTMLAGTVQAQTPTTPFSGMENLFDAGLGEIDKYFVELDDVMPPDGGVLIITGEASSLTVTVMAGGLVQIDVDSDLGMVGFEETINTTWAAL